MNARRSPRRCFESAGQREKIMAMKVQISCINKTPRTDPHLRISHVGGLSDVGSRWKLTEDEAITGIEDGRYAFYVSQSGHTVSVIIATHQGHKYLKTANDHIQPDNLLSLPECPSGAAVRVSKNDCAGRARPGKKTLQKRNLW